jgi:hypothetical protein
MWVVIEFYDYGCAVLFLLYHTHFLVSKNMSMRMRQQNQHTMTPNIIKK